MDWGGNPRQSIQQRSERSRTPTQASWPAYSSRGRSSLHSSRRGESPSSRPRSLTRRGLPSQPVQPSDDVSLVASSALPMVVEEDVADNSILPIIAQIRRHTDIFHNCSTPFQSLSTMKVSLLQTRDQKARMNTIADSTNLLWGLGLHEILAVTLL